LCCKPLLKLPGQLKFHAISMDWINRLTPGVLWDP
jgi:hypothetical protein